MQHQSAGATLPNDAILAALNKEHEAAWTAAWQICDKYSAADDSADDDPEYNALLVAAETICDSIIAFPARSLDGLKAKVAILRREYAPDTGADLLRQIGRGPKDAVASVLHDLLALV